MENIKNLYNSREKVIKLYNDYDKIKSEAKYKTKHEEGLKILTSKNGSKITNSSCTSKSR